MKKCPRKPTETTNTQSKNHRTAIRHKILFTLASPLGQGHAANEKLVNITRRPGLGDYSSLLSLSLGVLPKHHLQQHGNRGDNTETESSTMGIFLNHNSAQNIGPKPHYPKPLQPSTKFYKRTFHYQSGLWPYHAKSPHIAEMKWLQRKF